MSADIGCIGRESCRAAILPLGGARPIPECLDSDQVASPLPIGDAAEREEMAESEQEDVEAFELNVPEEESFALSSWETLDGAIAWIARGSAMPIEDWDRLIYWGASLWDEMSPDEVVEGITHLVGPDVSNLNRYLSWDEGEETDQKLTGYDQLARLLGHYILIWEEYAELEGERKPSDAVQEHLTDLISELCEPRTWEAHENLLDASEQLRRALAKGILEAFGRPLGSLSTDRMDHVSSPRERIPPSLFAQPVFLSQHGIHPLAKGYDENSGTHDLLFHDILIDGSTIEAAFPRETAIGSAQPVPKRRPAQARVATWLIKYAETCAKAKRKAVQAEAFRLCREDTGASDNQMRAGWSQVPEHLKRRRGERER